MLTHVNHTIRLRDPKRTQYAGIFHQGIVPVVSGVPYLNEAGRSKYRVAVSQLAGWQRQRLVEMLANKNAGIPPDLDGLDLTIDAKNADPGTGSAFLS